MIYTNVSPCIYIYLVFNVSGKQDTTSRLLRTSMFLRFLICTLCNTRKLSDLQDVSIRSIRYTICLNRSNVSQNSKV